MPRSVRFLAAFLAALLTAGSVAAAEVSDSQQIFRIKKILYENGILGDLDFPDGNIGPETRKGLRTVEALFGWPKTGQLSPKLYRRILVLGMPRDTTWAAVSIGEDSTEAFGVWNYESREKAVRLVRKRCADSSPNRKGCVVRSAKAQGGKTGWVGAMKCTRAGDAIVGTGYGKSIGDVQLRLLRRAKDRGFDRGQCKLFTLIAADGRHTK